MNGAAKSTSSPLYLISKKPYEDTCTVNQNRKMIPHMHNMMHNQNPIMTCSISFLKKRNNPLWGEYGNQRAKGVI